MSQNINQTSMLNQRLTSICLEIQGIYSLFNDLPIEERYDVISYFSLIADIVSEIAYDYENTITNKIIAKHSICCSCGKITHDNVLISHDKYMGISVPQCKKCNKLKRKINDKFVVAYFARLISRLNKIQNNYEVFANPVAVVLKKS